MKISLHRMLGVLIAVGLSGCGVQRFDIPHNSVGAPTVGSIVRRIKCELIELIRDDVPHPYDHRLSVLAGHYQVAVNLSLDVSDTGELAPTFAFPTNPTLTLNAALRLSRKRTQSFSEKIVISMDALQAEWKLEPSIGNCPIADTNLAGELGIKYFVTLAMGTEGLNRATPAAQGGAFGGSIEFAVTRNVNSVGATWVLSSFKGPGNLALLQRVNTDKVTFAFSASDATPEGTAAATARAQDYLNQLMIDQLRLR